jgi:hypothetical protein
LAVLRKQLWECQKSTICSLGCSTLHNNQFGLKSSERCNDSLPPVISSPNRRHIGYCLFEGSVAAYRWQQTFQQGLFPDNWTRELHNRDPCTSGFAWNQEECETCLQKQDLDVLWLARRMKPFCINPGLRVPSDLSQRLTALAENCPVDFSFVWIQMGTTAEDHTIEEIGPSLCAYAPKAHAALIYSLSHYGYSNPVHTSLNRLWNSSLLLAP